MRAGGCEIPAFAGKAASDCCAHDRCAPVKQADQCCKTSTASVTNYFQTREKHSDVGFSAEAQFLSLSLADTPVAVSTSRLLEGPVIHAPPGSTAQINAPLLI